MGERIDIQTGNGPTTGYLAVPEGGSGPGLVVIQEWWGLVPHIEDVADRFAAEGFCVLAPDLYHGESTTEPDEAGRMMQELAVEDAARDLSAAIDVLLARAECSSSKVGVIGFCMGGALALVAANIAPEKVAATAPFYAVFWYGDPNLSKVACPVQMHIGTADEYISVDAVESLADGVRSGGASVEVLTYDGAGHAFFNDSRPDAHDADAAAQARGAVLGFLRQHVS